MPLGTVLQALHSQINVLLQKIRAKHSPYRTSPVLGKSTLGVFSISAIAAGLSIWVRMSVLLSVQGGLKDGKGNILVAAAQLQKMGSL